MLFVLANIIFTQKEREPMSFVLIRIIFTQKKISKVALSGDDDKRIILEDGIHTIALGHFKSKNDRFSS